MKDDSIEVFTIGFDLDNQDMRGRARAAKSRAQEMRVRADSSAIKHYFEASTGEELDAALQEIIGNTERLALTQ